MRGWGNDRKIWSFFFNLIIHYIPLFSFYSLIYHYDHSYHCVGFINALLESLEGVVEKWEEDDGEGL